MVRWTEAQLYVADVVTSCAFFTSKLGFTVAFSYGDPPFFAQVKRDEARLNLRFVHEPVFNGDIREREGLLSATIVIATSTELTALYDEFRTADVPFAQHLKHEPWSATTFIITDPDANRILFAAESESVAHGAAIDTAR